jgi:Trk K+ transport system NAD-binding subunit
VLKALGSTMAQATARLGSPGPDDGERSATLAARAQRRRQLKTVLLLGLVFVAMVAVFSTAFHELMDHEGRSYSWPTSVYWTLTTMTTLGFGDITFESDAGRIFSIVVLLSGSTFLLVMLPFVFIQFVFTPWMAERERRRTPREAPAQIRDHLLLTANGPVEAALVERAVQADVAYVMIVDDPVEAGRLHDEGVTVMLGALDDPETYRRAHVDRADLVVATRNDPTNTNIAFTVREIAPDVDIIASANSPASVDILEIAGANRVVQLGDILGSAMAARTLGLDGRSNVIGEIAGLLIAEAGAGGSDLVGKSLAEAQLRSRLGVGIVGVWNRGRFEIATADTVVDGSTMLLLAGTAEQLAAYDRHHAGIGDVGRQHKIIIGGGRVGRAAGEAFAAEGMSYTVVEQLPDRERPGIPYVIGDAADRAVLDEAGLDRAGAVLITTHDDDINVYLTRYLRGLRPDIRIVSRARLDRNVTTLYRAGADSVLSYAATGSAAIWNHFRGTETVLVSEGLNVFRTPIPRQLVGKSLADAHVYRRTGCNVVAVDRGTTVEGNPDPHVPLPSDGELVLVATDEAEARFSEEYPHARRRTLRIGDPVGRVVDARSTDRPRSGR